MQLSLTRKSEARKLEPQAAAGKQVSPIGTGGNSDKPSSDLEEVELVIDQNP